jgi:hypothetical protein
MSGTVVPFRTEARGARGDVKRYRRDRLRGLEQRITFLEAERARLERLVALAVRAATGGTNVAPAALLSAIEDLDRQAAPDRVPQRPLPHDLDWYVELLRETAR